MVSEKSKKSLWAGGFAVVPEVREKKKKRRAANYANFLDLETRLCT